MQFELRARQLVMQTGTTALLVFFAQLAMHVFNSVPHRMASARAPCAPNKSPAAITAAILSFIIACILNALPRQARGDGAAMADDFAGQLVSRCCCFRRG